MKELNKVTVVKMNDGSIVKQSTNNPEFGFIRVQQESVSVVNNWMKKSTRSALINGAFADLSELGLTEGTVLPGKLVIDESLEPFNPGPYADRDLKHAFEGGPVCVFEDMPIYRRTRHTYNMDEHDTLIQHTNVDQIKEATAARRDALKSLSENTENAEDAEIEEVENTQPVKAVKKPAVISAEEDSVF